MADDHENDEEEIWNEAILLGTHVVVHDLLPVLADEAHEHGYKAVLKRIEILGWRSSVWVVLRDDHIILVEVDVVVEELDAEETEDEDDNQEQDEEVDYVLEGLANIDHHLVERVPIAREPEHAKEPEASEYGQRHVVFSYVLSSESKFRERNDDNECIELVHTVCQIATQSKTEQLDEHLSDENEGAHIIGNLQVHVEVIVYWIAVHRERHGIDCNTQNNEHVEAAIHADPVERAADARRTVAFARPVHEVIRLVEAPILACLILPSALELIDVCDSITTVGSKMHPELLFVAFCKRVHAASCPER